jgi:hypothetical protein
MYLDPGRSLSRSTDVTALEHRVASLERLLAAPRRDDRDPAARDAAALVLLHESLPLNDAIAKVGARGGEGRGRGRVRGGGARCCGL